MFFEAFVADGFDTLPDEALHGLERLLDLPDQDILAALVADDPASVPQLDEEMLRAARCIRASLARNLPR